MLRSWWQNVKLRRGRCKWCERVLPDDSKHWYCTQECADAWNAYWAV